jgi:flagellar motor switch/type III secretory pathway protein FliN
LNNWFSEMYSTATALRSGTVIAFFTVAMRADSQLVAVSTDTSVLPTVGSDDWGNLRELPCDLTLELPIPAFSVRDLLRLHVDSVIDTSWNQSTDIPLRANGSLIAWTEFEVVGEKLAVRLTELA